MSAIPGVLNRLIPEPTSSLMLEKMFSMSHPQTLPLTEASRQTKVMRLVSILLHKLSQISNLQENSHQCVCLRIAIMGSRPQLRQLLLLASLRMRAWPPHSVVRLHQHTMMEQLNDSMPRSQHSPQRKCRKQHRNMLDRHRICSTALPVRIQEEASLVGLVNAQPLLYPDAALVPSLPTFQSPPKLVIRMEVTRIRLLTKEGVPIPSLQA